VRSLREEVATARVSEETITQVQDAFFLRQSGGVMVDLLLQSGADINRTDKDGNTPLMLAAQNDQPNMVAYLLQNQADKTLKRADGRTALDLARAARNERVIALLN
ncbi:MAG: ankyrin repeat domain-containing protein, partial [Saprospiraceae bacterium]